MPHAELHGRPPRQIHERGYPHCAHAFVNSGDPVPVSSSSRIMSTAFNVDGRPRQAQCMTTFMNVVPVFGICSQPILSTVRSCPRAADAAKGDEAQSLFCRSPPRRCKPATGSSTMAVARTAGMYLTSNTRTHLAVTVLPPRIKPAQHALPGLVDYYPVST